MRLWPFRSLSALTVLVAAFPADGQSLGPPTSAFDGSYVGVSVENISSLNTLAGGRARVKWGDRMLEGYVVPDGALTMTTGYGQRFDGRNQGAARRLLRL